ncbi:MAG: hypothetical protein ACP5LP_01565 [Candidatus Micrarchaeia archaeon]
MDKLVYDNINFIKKGNLFLPVSNGKDENEQNLLRKEETKKPETWIKRMENNIKKAVAIAGISALLLIPAGQAYSAVINKNIQQEQAQPLQNNNNQSVQGITPYVQNTIQGYYEEQFFVSLSPIGASYGNSISAYANAVPQTYGQGIQYWINGLTNNGNFLSEGITYDHPAPWLSGIYPGWNMEIAIYNSQGQSVFGNSNPFILLPVNINNNDNVQLAIKIGNNSYNFLLYDNNSLEAEFKYPKISSSWGMEYFVGTMQVANNYGFSTGAGITIYHYNPYSYNNNFPFGQMSIRLTLQSEPFMAFLGADEWNPITKQIIYSSNMPIYTNAWNGNVFVIGNVSETYNFQNGIFTVSSNSQQYNNQPAPQPQPFFQFQVPAP